MDGWMDGNVRKTKLKLNVLMVRILDKSGMDFVLDSSFWGRW